MNIEAAENIPSRSWRDREMVGILVRAVGDADNAPKTVSGSINSLFLKAGIEFAERVHGQHSRLNDFVMIVDDEGRDKQLPYNALGHYLSGYNIQAPILGDVLFFSEDFTDDGMDIIPLRDRGKQFLLDPKSGGVELSFAQWCRVNIGYISEYYAKYPVPRSS